MKRILLASFLLTAAAVNAQENKLAPDQNPNYKISQDRYIKAQDELLASMNTTVQNTYKAYDWYEAKRERKQQRYNDRQERRLYRLQNQYYTPYNNYNNYYDPYSMPYRYGPRASYRHNGWRLGW